MSIRRVAALQVGFLLVAILANAASRNTMRITVLDSVTRAVPLDNNGVPTNCDGITFDAYCRSTTNVPLVSTLLVQDGDNPPFRISCAIDSKFSRCTPLPMGATFDARREKRGITVYYVDDKGKARKQLYTFVDKNGKPGPSATAAALAVQRAPAGTENSGRPPASAAVVPVAPVQKAPAPAAPPASVQGDLAQKANQQKVRCSFTSTPPGADITIDGSYVGDTPSEIGLTTGKHVVVIAKVGFGEWRRELTVSPDSAVNVTANLQTQP